MNTEFDLGEASIEPQHPVEAGTYITITYTYSAGHPVDDSGYLKITFRSVSDFGKPQFIDPKAPNYCTVSTTGDCQIEPRWDPKGSTRPWSQALYLKITRGYLDREETIRVIFGDSSGGSPGWQVQTHCTQWFEFKTFVDPIATYRFKELPASPGFAIIPGDSVRAVCIAPSQVCLNQAFRYHLKLEDRWGNPTSAPRAIDHPGFSTPGVQTVQGQDEEGGLSAKSNPIDVKDSFPLQAFWADFHGQSGETVGDGTIEEYFTFARDYGLLDISGHSSNDFQVTDDFWDEINRVNRQYYQPGKFVTFPGYEWSGNTPLGGDRNVYFESEGGEIRRSSYDLLPEGEGGYNTSRTASDLFGKLREASGPNPFVFAHVGGRYADLSIHDPEIELGIEIHSAWGTFEWFLADAIKRGYRIGICANSDGHKCRPGASYPGAGRFGSLGGLTCVLAQALTRTSVLEALQARHFYATTGNRSLIDVQILVGDGQNAMMGDVVAVSALAEPVLDIRVVGSSQIERLEIRNGTEVIQTFHPYCEADLGRRVKLIWRGAEVRGRDRMTTWDGRLRIRGNAIRSATPINFWNVNQTLRAIGDQELTWKSVTTGGLSGVILELAEAYSGSIQIETVQGVVSSEIASIQMEPQVRDFGGLGKEISIYRLPDGVERQEITHSTQLTNLQAGDNPIIIHMEQEDGHMAWSSPIYLVV